MNKSSILTRPIVYDLEVEMLDRYFINAFGWIEWTMSYYYEQVT